MAGGFRFLVSSSIQRRRGGSLVLRFLSHQPNSPSPLPYGPRALRRLSSDQDYRGSGLFFGLPPRDGVGFKVELVDDESWKVSSAIAQAWRSPEDAKSPVENGCDDGAEYSFDFDQIEELRLRKKLFFKLDKGSMEDDECSISLFARQKSKSKKKKSLLEDPAPPREKQVSRERKPTSSEGKSKRERIPTFSQSTDAYHLPFCLDVFITKGSVRACIVHRATSNVVSVAHSISKDMKFDLASRRDAAACAAVGSALAQRALSDDIHNVVYSPRKGEKIEGKLQIVLQSIKDAGIDVKVKIKQRKPLKGRGQGSTSADSEAPS